MIKIKGAFLFVTIILLGCQKEVSNEEPKVYSSEQEKILNESFLEIVGTDLYFKIEDKYLDKAIEISNAKGEAAGRKFYDKHKVEDTTRLLIFMRDKFVSSIYRYGRFADSLNPELLPIIRNYLIENNFTDGKAIALPILDSLSLPIKLSTLNISQSGRYQLAEEKNERKFGGEFKTYGTFNCSRIYIDSIGENACLLYERQYDSGSSFGTLVLLIKIGGKWKLKKKIGIYQT